MIRKKSFVKISLSIAVTLLLVAYLWRVSTQPVQTVLIPTESPSSGEPVPNFAKFEKVREKKSAFFNYLMPEIERQNTHMLSIRHSLMMMQRTLQQNDSLSHRDKQKLAWLANEYRCATISEDDLSDIEFNFLPVITKLLKRVDVIPKELVLVQAANESAWGTSRFARQGYNFFGLWCFEKGCGFVPKKRNEGASHEVAKFDNLTKAVYTYIRNLNRHEAYADLRRIRANLRKNKSPINASALAEGLTQYSERGRDYVEEIQAMIRVNQEYFAG